VFEVLSIDGVAPEHRRIEDTIDVAPYSIVRLGLLSDNPGDWMAHCHILPHAHGMMTVLRVAG
jgi:FtsP/CotA-like multicopper oxidase with cupredoxin domain